MKEQYDRKNILRRILQVTVFLLLTAVLLFVSAGTTGWTNAWVYIAISVLVMAANAFILPPELLSERGRKKENIENWDKIISALITLPWLAIYIVSGLDVRFGWSIEPALWIRTSGIIIFLSGNAFVTWSMISNAYFSTAVRIQYDRDHSVSKGGPYGLVRHPGYLGMIIYILATPIILGSLAGLIPACITVIMFIIRTAFEDNTLKKKLEGYREYSERTRYRLMPGIW